MNQTHFKKAINRTGDRRWFIKRIMVPEKKNLDPNANSNYGNLRCNNSNICDDVVWLILSVRVLVFHFSAKKRSKALMQKIQPQPK